MWSLFSRHSQSKSRHSNQTFRACFCLIFFLFPFCSSLPHYLTSFSGLSHCLLSFSSLLPFPLHHLLLFSVYAPENCIHKLEELSGNGRLVKMPSYATLQCLRAADLPIAVAIAVLTASPRRLSFLRFDPSFSSSARPQFPYWTVRHTQSIQRHRKRSDLFTVPPSVPSLLV